MSNKYIARDWENKIALPNWEYHRRAYKIIMGFPEKECM